MNKKDYFKMLNITDLTCRVCLQEQNILINVYDELEDLNTNLSNLLETCADFQIHEDDSFPKYLCEDCTRELLITSTFRQKCDKSKLILNEMLENAKVVELEELSNSSDIIEYCSEDLDNVEINDLIVGEPPNTGEDLITDIKPTDQVCQLSLLKKPPLEPIQCCESPNPTLYGTVEESMQTDSCSDQILLETVETQETLNVSWSGTPTILEDVSINNLFSQTSSEKPKMTNIFKCDICGALFKQAMNLQKHLQKSHDTKHCFRCNKCSHCFSLEAEFHKHVENCTYLKTIAEKNGNNKMINADSSLNTALEAECTRKCIYCQRNFPTPFALRMHLRTHTGERPFQCKFCSKSFKTQSQLNVHHKRHLGQADFICTICNKSFYEQSNLSVHMRSHTGERPHVCSICNKTFARVFLLQFHMRTHTGEKPFKCNFCDKYFRQHTDLRNHLTIHTGQKQHACTLCGKSYIKRSHLAQHMNKHHLDINAAETEEATKLDKHEKSETFYSLCDVIESESVIHPDNFE